MAVVETIRIEGDTSGIENKIQKLNKSIENLVDTVEDVGSESKKSFDKMDKEVKESGKTLKKTDSTLKSFVKNIKGAVVAAGAFAVVKGIFEQTQFAIDKVNQAMLTLTGFINNLPQILTNLGPSGIGGAIVDVADKAALLVELEKKALDAEVERQRIQLQQQQLIEVERQIRDDITLSIERRLQANDKIASLTQEQITLEKGQIEIQIKAAELREFITKKHSDSVALAQKRLQIEELNERTTSVSSERLANQNGLLQEFVSLQELKNENDAQSLLLRGSIIDREKEQLENIEKNIELEDVNVAGDNKVLKRKRDFNLQLLKLERDRYRASMELRINNASQRLQDLIDSEETETVAYEQALAQRQLLFAEYNKANAEQSRAISEERINLFNMEIEDLKTGFELAGQSAQAFADLNDALSAGDQANAEEAFKRTKALQLAGAIANTAASVTAQLAVPQDALTGANFVKAGIALTTGLAQIATIKSTKFEQEATTLPTTTVSAPTQPAQFNIVGQSGTNQLLEGIAGTFDRPVRAYVVSGEVLSGSQLDRQRIRTATFP
tara:strand:- start:206 stop:1876 length:1671 start_codon:yes stop_codon:yes gene_type:complete